MSNDLEEYLLKISNPVCFGPGVWVTIHTLALHAKTYQQKMDFIRNVEIILSNLRCLECRQKSLKYLQQHPISYYWQVIINNEDLGMFCWSVDFHNWKNRQLGKPEVPFEVAYRFYKYPDEFVCREDCGQKKIREKVPMFQPI